MSLQANTRSICHLLNGPIIRVQLGMLQQLLVPFSQLFRVGTNLLEQFSCSSNVLQSLGNHLRCTDSNLKEQEMKVASIDPGDVEATMNVQQLVANFQSFFYLVLKC